MTCLILIPKLVGTYARLTTANGCGQSRQCRHTCDRVVVRYRTRVEYCTKTRIGIRKRGQHFKKSPLPPISGKFDPKGKVPQDLGIKSEILGAFSGRHEE